MPQIILIAHNLRSAHNVGSLLRTADGIGAEKVYLTGYTPYPIQTCDDRLPHLANKIDKQISKTALGAQKSLGEHIQELNPLIKRLEEQGYEIVALEQDPNSVSLPSYKPPAKLAIIVGREVDGVEPDILALCSVIVEIPMKGSKESFNIVQATAMALYHFTYLR